MKQVINDTKGKLLNENPEQVHQVASDSDKIFIQSVWQRVVLLIVLGYEGCGALLGGILFVIAPDGRIMDMPVDIMHGFFSSFLIPGIILLGLGILNSAAFVAVLLRSRVDWLLSNIGMGGLLIWFIIEIVILQEFHWLHAIWGLPVLAGCLTAVPLAYFHLVARRI